ncbi:MAG: biotin--[acetyl-CoA-carboxylase] ligase, partial [Dehalococcoidia bacterium]
MSVPLSANGRPPDDRAMTAFDLDRFRAALRTDAFGRNLIFEASVGSTMDVARDAAGQGAPEGTLALADEQTAGRGRLGRSWLAPPAVNLLSTLLLRPPAAVLRQLAMIAPLAVCDAVEECHGLRLDIKWPNDVQARGKKLAGVLIEVPHPPASRTGRT